MTRYYFDSSDGDSTIIDEDGIELDDAKMARHEALRALPDMARDGIPDGDHRRFVVSVRGELGEIIYSVSLTLSGHWRDPASEPNPSQKMPDL